MTIKTKLTTGTIDILAADTVIHETSDRIAVSAFTCYSTAAATVTFYSSPDLTSASGDVIAKQIFAIDDTTDISPIISLGFTENIIAVGDAVGVNATASYTQYTGDDV